MYPSTEKRPRTNQATKSKRFARIANVFKLMLLTILARSTIMDVWRALITPPTSSNACSYLTLSWRRSLSYRNQSFNLQSKSSKSSKSMYCCLFDRDLRYEKVKCFPQFWRHQIYKHQNITSALVFTILFRIQTFLFNFLNFFITLPIWL